MSAPVRFLHAMAHATATLGLYSPGHPSRTAALDDAWRRLRALQGENAAPRFSFLDSTVIAGELPLHELRAWPWSRRLARAGIQRVEIDPDAGRDDLDRFIAHAAARLAASAGGGEPPPADGTEGPLRWGPLGLRHGDDVELASGSGRYRVDEEIDLVRWIYDRAESAGEIPVEEVETVVTSLAVAVHCNGPMLEPLLERADDRYGALHAVNVATLSMALAERLGIGSRDVRAIGTAALLCDIGMTRIPRDVLESPVLTAAQRKIVQRHTTEGARMLLARRGDFDLAAVVAYEHHLQPDGRGYPHLAEPREPHYVSRLVRVCDVYDALRSIRAARPAWSAEEALGHLERGAGSSFDGGLAAAFVQMMTAVEREAL
ncbi:MAG: HD domain-containing protein [Gemmatimonadota bacterium]|nr:HD domain-containing protein [Gemmatimonadota bacterium]